MTNAELQAINDDLSAQLDALQGRPSHKHADGVRCWSPYCLSLLDRADPKYLVPHA